MKLLPQITETNPIHPKNVTSVDLVYARLQLLMMQRDLTIEIKRINYFIHHAHRCKDWRDVVKLVIKCLVPIIKAIMLVVSMSELNAEINGCKGYIINIDPQESPFKCKHSGERIIHNDGAVQKCCDCGEII